MIAGKTKEWNNRENTTDKLRVGIRGGAKMTVKRFYTVVLLPLVRCALNSTLLHGNQDDH